MSDKSYSLDNEHDELGSYSVYSGSYSFCAFPFCAEESVANVLGSDVFAFSSACSFHTFILSAEESVAGGFASDVFHQQESIPNLVYSFKYFCA